MLKFKIQIILFFVSTLISNIFAQTNWTKYYNNLVHPNAFQPTVILENDTFKMWYSTGIVDSIGLKVVICYATSIDGIIWDNYYANPVVDVGNIGTWDSRARDTPFVLKDSEGYKLWFTGADHIGGPYNDSLTLVIGFGTSINGIDWNILDNPVLYKGSILSWDGLWIESPSVIFENNKYQMWYTGISSDYFGNIGYAESSDGINWIKDQNNPVLETGIAGSGEDFLVGLCTVIKRDSLYEMLYAGVSTGDLINDTIDTINIGYATSTDVNNNWVKYLNNPVITTYYPVYDPDSTGPWAPSLIFSDNEYKLWYETNSGVGYATSQITGINENIVNINDGSLQVFPNPFSDFCNIKISEYSNIKILDIAGREIESFYGNEIIWYPNKNISEGLYFIYIVSNISEKTKKILYIK